MSTWCGGCQECCISSYSRRAFRLHFVIALCARTALCSHASKNRDKLSDVERLMSLTIPADTFFERKLAPVKTAVCCSSGQSFAMFRSADWATQPIGRTTGLVRFFVTPVIIVPMSERYCNRLYTAQKQVLALPALISIKNDCRRQNAVLIAIAHQGNPSGDTDSENPAFRLELLNGSSCWPNVLSLSAARMICTSRFRQ